MKVIKADSSSPAAEPSPCLWFCWGWLARSGSLQQATTGKGMNQVFQASPVRSDSFKPWIRALGLLCWLQISSWFPAYNFTFKARGLETFPVSPAPAGRAQHHLLSCTHKQWLCWKNKVWPHENIPSAAQIPLQNINLELWDAALGLCCSKISVDHVCVIPKGVKFISQWVSSFWIFIIFVISALQKNYRIRYIP